MKKHLYAGLLTAVLAAPALAAVPNKFAPKSPQDPLHRSSILLCVTVLIGLGAYRHRPRMPKR